MAVLTAAERVKLARRLSKSSTFRTANPSHILGFLEDAQRIEIEPNVTVYGPGAVVPGGVVLLEGEYRIVDIGLDIVADGGAIIGLDAILLEQAPAVTIASRTRGKYVVIPAENIRALFRRSPAFAQSLAKTLVAPDGISPAPALKNVKRPAIVKFDLKQAIEHSSILVDLLGQQIASSFLDRVAFVKHVPSAPQLTSEQVPLAGPGCFSRVSAPDIAPDALRASLPEYDYIFIDPSIDYAADHDILLKPVSTPSLKPMPSVKEKRVLELMLITDEAPSKSNVLTFIDANDESPVTENACRVHLRIKALGQIEALYGDQPPLTGVGDELGASLGRWARALTQRRTGIAIGGGGVFAMIGVYVIEQLRDKEVPIDIITGTSGGALVGGYYAARGLEGLKELVDLADNHWLGAAVWGAHVTGAALEWFVRETLGNLYLEQLPHADFFPAISDLSTGKGVIAVKGPLALGIRASGAAPPLFPPLISEHKHLIDGGFTNNVPVQAAQRLDAAVTLGLNVYPPARAFSIPWMPDFLMNLNASLNPVTRLLSLWTGFNVLASVSGRVQADTANVGYNADGGPAPFCTASRFDHASEIIFDASTDDALNQAIKDFVDAWTTVKNRGFQTS